VIRLNCPSCSHPCEFADFLAGLTVVCKKCGHRIPVPKTVAAGSAITAVPEAKPPQASVSPPPPEAITTSTKPVAPVRPAPPADAVQSKSEPPPASANPGSGITRPIPRSIVKEQEASDAPPQWALDQVRDSLTHGQSVLAIQQILVARGLAPAIADAAVNTVLKLRSLEQAKSPGPDDPNGLWHRVLSAIVACLCIGLGYWIGGGLYAGFTCARIVLPLACIWFPYWIPHWTSIWLDRFGSDTQQLCLRYLGWLLLIVLGGYRVFLFLLLEAE
jgi:hypothetical protein